MIIMQTINYSPWHSTQNLHASEVTSRVIYNYLIRRTNTANVQRGLGKNEGEWTGELEIRTKQNNPGNARLLSVPF